MNSLGDVVSEVKELDIKKSAADKTILQEEMYTVRLTEDLEQQQDVVGKLYYISLLLFNHFI